MKICKIFGVLSIAIFISISAAFAQQGGYNMQSSQPPAWPMANTEAGVDPSRIDNPFAADVDKPTQPDGWSGGADLVPAESAIAKYAREEQAASFMPLGTKDMLVDDGAKALSASIQYGGGFGAKKTERDIIEVSLEDVAENNKGYGGDDVKDWIAKEGLTLREILQEWAKMDGWEIIWNTPREYPLRASAIFRGRFQDVTSALIRGFSKATPPPYARFYMGNRVIVINTMEDDND
jgi:hypothetical protein